MYDESCSPEKRGQKYLTDTQVMGAGALNHDGDSTEGHFFDAIDTEACRSVIYGRSEREFRDEERTRAYPYNVTRWLASV